MRDDHADPTNISIQAASQHRDNCQGFRVVSPINDFWPLTGGGGLFPKPNVDLHQELNSQQPIHYIDYSSGICNGIY